MKWNWASWWNGVLTVIGTINTGFLVHWLWTHDADGISGSVLLGIVLFIFWGATIAAGTKN